MRRGSSAVTSVTSSPVRTGTPLPLDPVLDKDFYGIRAKAAAAVKAAAAASAASAVGR